MVGEATCRECGDEVSLDEAVKNREGFFHEDCMEDHQLDMAAEQRKSELRALRKSKREAR